MRADRTRSQKQRHRSMTVGTTIGLVVGLGLGAIAGLLLPSAVSDLQKASPATAIIHRYFTDLAGDRFRQAESLTIGQATAALRFNTQKRHLTKVPLLSISILPEETGTQVIQAGVAVESGGPLPTVAQFQVLAIDTPAGWRVADVWNGSTPVQFRGQATTGKITTTARDWLTQVTQGNFGASLTYLSGGALSSAEQSGQNAIAWARSVKIGTPVWRVLGIDGSWGAVEGTWQAVTPAGHTNVALVLLGQIVAGRWRVTRVVVVS